MTLGELRRLLREERKGTITAEEHARLDEWRHVGQRMNATVPSRAWAMLRRQFEALEVHDRLASLASRPTPRSYAAPRARAPRSRRVTRAARASAGDDPSDESDLAVIPLSAFRAELERALGGRA